MSAKLSSAALVRRLYRKFQTNERGAFSFPSFLSLSFSLVFSFLFFFFFFFVPSGSSRLRPRGLKPRTLEKSMLRLSIFRSAKRGNIDNVLSLSFSLCFSLYLRTRGTISIVARFCCVPRSRVPQFANE